MDFDLAVVTIIIQLILLEGLLSIDNAAVLSAMVAHLPNDQPIPWPRPLRFMAGWSSRVLGMQRDAALKVGLLGAYLGRALMLLVAGFISQALVLQIAGALYLLYLGINHFANLYREQEQERATHRHIEQPKGGFWEVVLGLELADLAFSLDNVVVAVALSDQMWVVMLGVAIGIVVMRFAASLFVRVIQWEPALEHGAFLLLLAIGVELLLDKIFHIHTGELLQFAISVGLLVLTVVVARSQPLRHALIIFRPVLMLFTGIQLVVTSLIVRPIALVFGAVAGVVMLPFQHRG